MLDTLVRSDVTVIPVNADSTWIETERLVLRPPRIEDFDGWAGLMGDAEAARFIGGVQPRAVAWRGLMTMAGAWSLQGFAMFSVIEKSTGRWIGRLGPWMPEDWPGTEIGWALIRDCWGRGYATEGATAAIDWAFATLAWVEVIHLIAVDNHASRAVAKKLGSQNRGPARMPSPYESVQTDVWGQSRSEWLARRR